MVSFIQDRSLHGRGQPDNVNSGSTSNYRVVLVQDTGERKVELSGLAVLRVQGLVGPLPV